jgi:hypothetical protein
MGAGRVRQPDVEPWAANTKEELLQITEERRIEAVRSPTKQRFIEKLAIMARTHSLSRSGGPATGGGSAT